MHYLLVYQQITVVYKKKLAHSAVSKYRYPTFSTEVGSATKCVLLSLQRYKYSYVNFLPFILSMYTRRDEGKEVNISEFIIVFVE